MSGIPSFPYPAPLGQRVLRSVANLAARREGSSAQRPRSRAARKSRRSRSRRRTGPGPAARRRGARRGSRRDPLACPVSDPGCGNTRVFKGSTLRPPFASPVLGRLFARRDGGDNGAATQPPRPARRKRVFGRSTPGDAARFAEPTPPEFGFTGETASRRVRHHSARSSAACRRRRGGQYAAPRRAALHGAAVRRIDVLIRNPTYTSSRDGTEVRASCTGRSSTGEMMVRADGGPSRWRSRRKDDLRPVRDDGQAQPRVQFRARGHAAVARGQLPLQRPSSERQRVTSGSQLTGIHSGDQAGRKPHHPRRDDIESRSARHRGRRRRLADAVARSRRSRRRSSG
jgi:hypothetical protein